MVAYDVSDDGRRSSLAALLQVWGDRLQRPLFLLQIDTEELAELEARARGLLNPSTDSLYVIRLCKSCWEGHVAVGQAFVPPPTLMWAVL